MYKGKDKKIKFSDLKLILFFTLFIFLTFGTFFVYKQFNADNNSIDKMLISMKDSHNENNIESTEKLKNNIQNGETEKDVKDFLKYPPSYYISKLFNIHKQFSYTYKEDDKNKTIYWVIKGPSFALKILEYHVKQMDYLLKKGFVPRPRDPIFVLESKVKKYIITKVENKEGTLIIKKEALNDCAYDVIKLHAEVIKGFFEEGRREAMGIHEVPPSTMEKCKNYLK